MRGSLWLQVLLAACLASQAMAQADSATAAAPSPAPALANSSACVYAVKSGDTLSDIAFIFSVDVSAIQGLNPDANPARLMPGQNITVPCGGPVICTYTIKSGDTMASIATLHSIEVADLQKMNPSVAAVQLRIGQELNMPCTDPGCTVSVKKGDTLAAIAQAQGIDVDSILGLNKGLDPTKLYVEQVLKIPCNSTAPDGSATKGCTFSMKAGLTLAGVAAAWKVSVAELEALNPGIDATTLQVDQAIAVPCTDPALCLHTVVANDTLAKIAAAAGSSVQEVQAANGNLDPTKLLIGQNIWVRCPCKYEIQSGDTLNKIGAKFGTTGADVLARNPGIDPSKIFIGQALVVPCTATTTTSSSGGSSRRLLL